MTMLTANQSIFRGSSTDVDIPTPALEAVGTFDTVDSFVDESSSQKDVKTSQNKRNTIMKRLRSRNNNKNNKKKSLKSREKKSARRRLVEGLSLRKRSTTSKNIEEKKRQLLILKTTVTSESDDDLKEHMTPLTMDGESDEKKEVFADDVSIEMSADDDDTMFIEKDVMEGENKLCSGTVTDETQSETVESEDILSVEAPVEETVQSTVEKENVEKVELQQAEFHSSSSDYVGLALVGILIGLLGSSMAQF